MKKILKIMLASSALFLIAIYARSSYAMNSENNANDGNNGFKYRCIVTNGDYKAISNVVTLTVK